MLGFLDDQPSAVCRAIIDQAQHVASPERCEQLLTILMALLEAEGPGSADDAYHSKALTTELVVGGVLSVIHARILNEDNDRPLVELAPSLMAFIVAPYLGPAAARSELTGVSEPEGVAREQRTSSARATYRTTLVLRAIADAPGSSNREIAEAAGLRDEGQTSKLLSRLERGGAIANAGLGAAFGEANSWLLTAHGESIARHAEHGMTPASRRSRGAADAPGRRRGL